MIRTLPLCLVAGLTACTGAASLDGQIGGESVPTARDAAYDTTIGEIPFVGTFQTFSIVISDIPDVCTTFTRFSDNVEIGCQEQCEDWSRIVQEEGLGDDRYYALSLLAVVDPARVEGEVRLGGAIPAENEFTGTFVEWDTSHIQDEAGCIEWCEAGNDILPSVQSRFSSGTVDLDSYDDDKQVLHGGMDISFGGEDSLEGSFKADRCEGLL